jgi:hypothetical protein
LHDTKGDRLMSREGVSTMLENMVGECIDSMKLGHILGARERIELLDGLLVQLPKLAAINALMDEFNDAQEEHNQ